MSEIKIVVDESGVHCNSPLAPEDTVFWLEAAKFMILEDFMGIGKSVDES